MKAAQSATRLTRSPVVLIVDDHEDTRDIYAAWLGAAGLEALVASDAIGALTVVDRRRVDAVVLDIGLPGTSGVQLSRELRTRPSSKHAIVVAVSGFPPAVAAGGEFDSYLLKPCLPETLLDEIRRLLADDRRGDGPLAVVA